MRKHCIRCGKSKQENTTICLDVRKFEESNEIQFHSSTRIHTIKAMKRRQHHISRVTIAHVVNTKIKKKMNKIVCGLWFVFHENPFNYKKKNTKITCEFPLRCDRFMRIDLVLFIIRPYFTIFYIQWDPVRMA